MGFVPRLALLVALVGCPSGAPPSPPAQPPPPSAAPAPPPPPAVAEWSCPSAPLPAPAPTPPPAGARWLFFDTPQAVAEARVSGGVVRVAGQRRWLVGSDGSVKQAATPESVPIVDLRVEGTRLEALGSDGSLLEADDPVGPMTRRVAPCSGSNVAYRFGRTAVFAHDHEARFLRAASASSGWAEAHLPIARGEHIVDVVTDRKGHVLVLALRPRDCSPRPTTGRPSLRCHSSASGRAGLSGTLTTTSGWKVPSVEGRASMATGSWSEEAGAAGPIRPRDRGRARRDRPGRESFLARRSPCDRDQGLPAHVSGSTSLLAACLTPADRDSPMCEGLGGALASPARVRCTRNRRTHPRRARPSQRPTSHNPPSPPATAGLQAAARGLRTTVKRSKTNNSPKGAFIPPERPTARKTVSVRPKNSSGGSCSYSLPIVGR